MTRRLLNLLTVLSLLLCFSLVALWLYDRWQFERFMAQNAAPRQFVVVHSSETHVGGVPGWLLVLLTSILPLSRGAALLHRFAARVRPRQGFCRRCGYDLRATPGRCPECGTAAMTPA